LALAVHKRRYPAFVAAKFAGITGPFAERVDGMRNATPDEMIGHAPSCKNRIIVKKSKITWNMGFLAHRDETRDTPSSPKKRIPRDWVAQRLRYGC